MNHKLIRGSYEPERSKPEFGMDLRSWDLWLPLAILIMGVVLLQHHSIQFWQTWVGLWAGVGWALLLELISLWLWFKTGDQNNKWNGRILKSLVLLLAMLATVVLLFGPLYQVSRPTIDNWRRTLVASQEVKLLREEIANNRKGLLIYRQNSLTRLGWQGKIDQIEVKLQENRKRLMSLLIETKTRFQWERLALVAMQLIALILFQVANILTIRTISHHFRSTETNPPQFPWEGKNVSERGFPLFPDDESLMEIKGDESARAAIKNTGGVSNFDDQRVAQLQLTIKARLDSKKISQAAFCRQHGIRPRDLSLLFNYFRLKAEGKRKVPKTLIDQLAQRFLHETGKGAGWAVESLFIARGVVDSIRPAMRCVPTSAANIYSNRYASKRTTSNIAMADGASGRWSALAQTSKLLSDALRSD